MDLSRPGLGLAILDEGIVGRSVREGVLGLSLLRAPNFPDPECDRGEHRLRYSLMPHGGDRRVAGHAGVDAEAEAFAEPLVVRRLKSEETSSGVARIRVAGWNGPRRVDLRERPLETGSELMVAADGTFEVPMRPFGIESIRLQG